MTFLCALWTLLVVVAPVQAADAILRVRAAVPNAEVFVDGASLGPVPVTAYLTPGTHSLRVVADFHEPYVRKLEAIDGKAIDVTAPMVESLGSVEWIGQAGARLWVDGQERGALPIRLPDIAPGAHTWRVEAPRLEPREGKLEFVAGKNYLLTVDMTSSKGVFVFDSTPAGAEVWLDGRNVGVTPMRMEHVMPGVHGVELKLADRASLLRSVDTNDGSRGEVTATLARNGATLSVTTGADDAWVYVNDVPIGSGGHVSYGPIEKGRIEVRVASGANSVSTAVSLPGSGKYAVKMEDGALVRQAPLVQRWGFWAAVGGGAVAIAGGATVAAVVADAPPLPTGDTVETLP